jgi:hypothetical protein
MAQSAEEILDFVQSRLFPNMPLNQFFPNMPLPPGAGPPTEETYRDDLTGRNHAEARDHVNGVLSGVARRSMQMVCLRVGKTAAQKLGLDQNAVAYGGVAVARFFPDTMSVDIVEYTLRRVGP